MSISKINIGIMISLNILLSIILEIYNNAEISMMKFITYGVWMPIKYKLKAAPSINNIIFTAIEIINIYFDILYFKGTTSFIKIYMDFYLHEKAINFVLNDLKLKSTSVHLPVLMSRSKYFFASWFPKDCNKVLFLL